MGTYVYHGRAIGHGRIDQHREYTEIMDTTTQTGMIASGYTTIAAVERNAVIGDTHLTRRLEIVREPDGTAILLGRNSDSTDCAAMLLSGDELTRFLAVIGLA